MNTEEGLKREIGVVGLTSNIINTVIGAGIFVLPAIVSEGLGAAGILAYLFCGFLIAVVMMCFAEVGSKITVTGGAYAYIEAAFGRYFGFITTNLFIFGASLMATAAVANAIADTLSYFIPALAGKFSRTLFFLVLFSVLTVINVTGVKQGITLVKLTTLAKITPLLLLICLGSTHVSLENLKWNSIPALVDFGKVSLILFFAFQGAENSLSVSGEVKNPDKTIPKSILLSITFVLIIYIGVQLIAQGVLGNALLNFKKAPLAAVAKTIVGPFGASIMIIGAAVSMFGYLSSDILNMPRVLFRAAIDNVIPVKPLAKVNKKYATPYISIISFTVLGCFFSITGEFKQLAILSTSSVLLIYLGVALAVIKLRVTLPDKASFKIPGGLIVPVVAIIVIIWFLTNLTMEQSISMLIFIALLSFVYYVLKFFKLNQKVQTMPKK